MWSKLYSYGPPRKSRMGLSKVNVRPIEQDLCAQSTHRETTDLSNLKILPLIDTMFSEEMNAL